MIKENQFNRNIGLRETKTRKNQYQEKMGDKKAQKGQFRDEASIGKNGYHQL